MDRFLWIPGEGIDPAALARLRSRCKRPATPMGEAWFMGEKRRMFDELLGDIEKLSTSEVQKSLEEIASGTSSFGPHEEWNSWYHFLLGALLPRSHEAFVSYLLEDMVNGFIALYPNGVHQPPYKQFLGDALLTLGKCMMDRHCWDGSDIAIGRVLHRSNNNPSRIWRWWDASGDFSSSMFFCMKYLPENLVEQWLMSALAISSPHWRAQFMVWMVGAHELLNGQIGWPSEIPGNARPAVSWNWSHCLGVELATTDESGALPMASLLPEGSRLLALQLFRSHFTEDVYLEWLMGIAKVSYLESELAEIPETFEKLYVA